MRRGLREALNGFLDALGHGACPTTTYVGLRGFSLKDMDTADVGVGVLRRLTQEEVRSFVTEEDPQPVRDDELCLVLTSEATWSITDAPPKPAGGSASGVLPRLELFPALMLLAEGARNRRGQLRAPHVVWSCPSPYFFTGGTLSRGSNPDLLWRTSDFFDGILTPGVAEEARSLLPSLTRAPASAMRVVVHRLVSACLVYNKTDEDRLVDAAVAWQAMFGSQDRDQLALQLALGIAWLLAPNDHNERERIFRRAKKVYTLRSKLVHGGATKTPDVGEAANDLIEWLRRALLALITTHSPLLGASDRAQRVLLQNPGNLAPTYRAIIK